MFVTNMHPIREKRITNYLREWVTSDFLQLTKDKEFYYDKAHITNNPLDWNKAKTHRNKVNNLSKVLKKNYYNNEIEQNLSNSKKLWKTIKKVIPSKNKNNIGNIKVNDKITADDNETANVFNNHFTTIGTNLANKFDSNHDKDDDLCTDYGNILTTVEWVGLKLTFLEKDICHDHEIDILRSLAKLQLTYV